eukprot:5027573-Pleurochrysis_carterae.AAC.1
MRGGVGSYGGGASGPVDGQTERHVGVAENKGYATCMKRFARLWRRRRTRKDCTQRAALWTQGATRLTQGAAPLTKRTALFNETCMHRPLRVRMHPPLARELGHLEYALALVELGRERLDRRL